MGGGTRDPGRIMALLYAVVLALAAMFLLSVPVRALSAELDLPVPTAVIYPGQSVTGSGLNHKAFIVKDDKLSLYVVDASELEGRVARRTLLPGKAIRLSDLKEPDLVRAGTPVTMVYSDAGLVITGQGTALRSAGEGEVIRVRNVDSGTIVSGVVASDGSIRITG